MEALICEKGYVVYRTPPPQSFGAAVIMKLTWMVGVCVVIYFGGMLNVYGVEDQKTLTIFPPRNMITPLLASLKCITSMMVLWK